MTTRGPLDPYVAGWDGGNATCSMSISGVGTAFFPSFIATVGIGKYDGLSKIETSRHHISYNGQNAIIGLNASEMTGYDTLLAEYGDQAQKRYTEPVSLMSFLASISAVMPCADVASIKLGTGAPLSIYRAHGEAIRRRYIGEHQYIYNGHARRVIVPEVQVLGECREFLRLLSPDQRRGRIIGHDIGGRTYNVVAWYDGAVIGQKTYDMGIDKLLTDVASVSGDPLARWKMHQDIRTGGRSFTKHQSELEKLLDDARRWIERKFPLADTDKHIIGGGGAFGLANVLRAAYRNTDVIILNGDRPEGANATAYAAAMNEV